MAYIKDTGWSTNYYSDLPQTQRNLVKKTFHIKVSAVKFELVFSYIFLQSSYSKGDQYSIKIATAIQTP